MRISSSMNTDVRYDIDRLQTLRRDYAYFFCPTVQLHHTFTQNSYFERLIFADEIQDIEIRSM